MCLTSARPSFSPPPSPDAKQDVALLLRRQNCGTPQLRSFSLNLGTALTLPSHSFGAMNWAAGSARAAEYEGIFENCRRQAPDGVADGWCACYIRNYSEAASGSAAAPAEALQQVRSSAFVGSNFFDPGKLQRCESCTPGHQHMAPDPGPAPQDSACLLSATPLAGALQPGTQACRYRTAWGEIEVRRTNCPLSLQTNQWGGETVACAPPR